MSSLKLKDGELEIDCRAGGGLSEDVARLAHLPKIRDGSVYHCATMTCMHCAGVVIVNELRTRPREYCRTCNGYVCDHCHAVRTAPDYVHMSFAAKAEAVRSGKFRWEGPASSGRLIPILKEI